MAKKVALFAIALLVVMGAGWAWAADDFMANTQGYGFGAWYTSIYGQVTSGGTTISARSDLGLTSGYGIVADANWQLGDKWGIDLNYTYLKSKRDKFSSPKTYNFEGKVVTVNDQVDTSLSLSVIKGLIRYSIVRNEDGQLDLGVAPLYVNADVNIYDRTRNLSLVNENKGAFFALPSLSGKQRLSERLYFSGYAQGLSVSQQRMIDVRADLCWNFQHPGWFATIGYRYTDIKVNLSGNRKATVHWNGPMITLRAEF